MQFATRAIYNTYDFQHVQFATYAIYNMFNLQHMQFATCAICNMGNLKNTSISTMEVKRALPCEVGSPSPERWEGVSVQSFLQFIGRGMPFINIGHQGHWRLYSIERAFIVCFLQLRDFSIWEIYFIIMIDFLIYVWEISKITFSKISEKEI